MSDRTHDGPDLALSRAERSDRGTTFIEVLVSVVILGIAGVAVLAGMAAALRGSSTHDQVATVQANLADAGDHLTDVTYANDTYFSCATPANYDVEVDPWQVTVRSIQYWNSATLNWGGCPPGSTDMQRITLESTVGGLTRQLTVVKRQATVAVTAGGAWNDGMVTPNPHPQL